VLRDVSTHAGAFNLHAGERVVLLAATDGTFQHTHHVGTQQNTLVIA